MLCSKVDLKFYCFVCTVLHRAMECMFNRRCTEYLIGAGIPPTNGILPVVLDIKFRTIKCRLLKLIFILDRPTLDLNLHFTQIRSN